MPAAGHTQAIGRDPGFLREPHLFLLAAERADMAESLRSAVLRVK